MRFSILLGSKFNNLDLSNVWVVKMITSIVQKLVGLSRTHKRLIQVCVDLALILSCFYFAMILRLENESFLYDRQVWLAVAPVLPLTVMAFRQLGLYRSVLRYITGQAAKTIAAVSIFSAAMLMASSYIFSAPIPRSVPSIYAVLLILSAGGVRFWMRTVFRRPSVANREPIIIYGAGEAGRQLQNALQLGHDYLPVALVDDDASLQGTSVGGRRVYAPEEIERLVQEYQVKSILLALPSASRARRREIISSIEPLGLDIKTIPGMADIVSGRASFSELRRVSPEDLLGRDPVPPRDDLMQKNIAGKVVLVSGAGGSIGSELCRQIIKHGPEKLVLLEVSEYALYAISSELNELMKHAERQVLIEPVLGSVQNPGRVRAILRSFGVQTIYHAAAYKHVVLVEENVVEGIRNNVFGTKVIAEAAAEIGVENFILVSTDKAVRPTNFMGASKRMAELVCQSLAAEQNRTTFSMVRFGNVLGSSGSVIPKFRDQIEKGGPVTVTHPEVTRYFMTIPEAAQLVIQASAMARGGDVFVLDMGEPVKIIDLAQSMIRLHGLKPYLMDDSGKETSRGDIGIAIVGLNKGEKLYEELLIGNAPKGTDHPRIMTATEVSLSKTELATLLSALERACLAFDIPSVREVFLKAPLEFQPNNDDLHDLMWNAAQSNIRGREPKLKVISDE